MARDNSHAVDGMRTPNSHPTINVADEDQLAQNAPPNQFRTAKMTIADPDIAAGDLEIVVHTTSDPAPTPTANQLLVTVTAEPAGVVKEMGYHAGAKLAFFTIKPEGALCALDPRPDGTFETVFTVTATDSHGASVSKEIVGTTAFDTSCTLAVDSASVDGRVLTLDYGQVLDKGSKPAPRDFSVTAAGRAKPVSGVEVSGSTVVLTLASAVGEGEPVTVSYTADATRPIRRADDTGSPAESFAGQAVTNVTGETPTLESAAVNGTTLTLLYDEALDQGSVPVIGDFTVTVAGSTVSVTGVAMTHSAVVLTLADAVTAGQRVTVSYTRGANPIRDTRTPPYEAANLDGVAVGNRASDTRAPRLVSATVQGNVLTLVYDEALDPSRKPHANRFYVSVDIHRPQHREHHPHPRARDRQNRGDRTDGDSDPGSDGAGRLARGPELRQHRPGGRGL